ncbi:MarR family winged helix-turn-helix transcriptional regulator [Streptomyces sp. NPDC050560]|uniref:MarR family winged helix-turn-helix transcriptional regulator n=1 Tax=Streptomyces sp. NPDC050560 TaxID=3365630 RepID=UPI003799117C
MRNPAADSGPPAEAPPAAVPPALPLDTTAGHLIRRAQQAHTAIWSAEVGGDVTSPQYAILSAVGRTPGVDQQTAGRLASLDKSTTANVVERLERRGWIARGRDTEDGRRNILELSAEAKSTLHGLTARVAAVQERLMAPLGPHLRRTFHRLLGRVAYQGPVPAAGGGPGPGGDVDVLGLTAAAGHLIRRAEQVHGVLWGRHVGALLTPSQYALLSGLAWRPAIDQTAAGEMASLDKSSTADIVARLRRRGWILDTRDETDRRRKLLTLTDLAHEALAEVTPAVRTVQRDLVAPLSPREQDRLVSLLRRIAYR